MKTFQPCVHGSLADDLIREADDLEVSSVVVFGQRGAALGWLFSIVIGVPAFYNSGRALGEDPA